MNSELKNIEKYFDKLWPLLRSITGDGARATHNILSELVPLETIEVSSGTEVFDWVVPKEWVVHEAYLLTPDGDRILDVNENNLHLLNYSVPFKGTVSLTELNEHLYSKPELPDAIPYITSYYKDRWGFCISENQRKQLVEGEYQVVINTEHIDGSMTLSEAILPGKENKEVLLTTYTCHPSMANDELSGPLALSLLYKRIAAWPERRLTYRFVFHPETIGSITYLKLKGDALLKNVIAGYVVTNVGVSHPFIYKRSRRSASLSDNAAIYSLIHQNKIDFTVKEYEPLGSDERQYCSPGFNLPVGVLSRTPNYYPEYHTSLDNREFVSFEAIIESVDMYEKICTVIDRNDMYINQKPFCEPQLGKRGLYPTVGRTVSPDEEYKALLWLINYSDGNHDLITIAEKSGISVELLHDAANKCTSEGLLKKAE